MWLQPYAFNELVDEGLLLRRRQPNQKDYRNDPTWQ